MLNTKGTRVIIGVCLIVVQLVSIFSVSLSGVGLYPNGTDIDLEKEYQTSGLNFQMVLSAAIAGVDRMVFSAEELFISAGELNKEDPYKTHENISLSEIQITSAQNREALGYSHGKSFGLVIYDIILTISYCTVGILGVVLLLLPDKHRRRSKHRHHHHAK